MYDQFQNNLHGPSSHKESLRNSAYGSDAVVFALKEKYKEIAYTRKKAEALLSKVQNTRTLVSLPIRVSTVDFAPHRTILLPRKIQALKAEALVKCMASFTQTQFELLR
jgi:hypothetical protein